MTNLSDVGFHRYESQVWLTHPRGLLPGGQFGEVKYIPRSDYIIPLSVNLLIDLGLRVTLSESKM